jgi:hypothetical protein
MNTIDTDTYYSQLQTLTAKRAADIAEHGTEYRLANTERSYRAVFDPKSKGCMFQSDAPLQPGQLYESKKGTICILSAQSFPGTICALVAEVVGSAAVMQKTATHSPQGAAVVLTSTAQVTPILSDTTAKSDEITVPVRFAAIKGRVLKTASGLYEVTGARIAGQVAHLTCQVYREPETKSLKREQARPGWVTNAPSANTWHSTDVWGW